MINAQLSFHGYRDAVKFFVAVPGQPPSKILHEDETNSESLPTTTTVSNTTDTSALAFGDILVVSGGDGYIDFRIGDSSTEKTDELTNNNNRNMSYLIVWHLGSI
jgi:mitogen-activated protein kinase 8 interacting protein 3